jgi:hypothetical protein
VPSSVDWQPGGTRFIAGMRLERVLSPVIHKSEVWVLDDGMLRVYAQ